MNSTTSALLWRTPSLRARAGPGPLRETDDANAMPLGHRRALVLRSGVDRDDVLATRARDDRRQDPVQRRGCVVDGNDHVQARIGVFSPGDGGSARASGSSSSLAIGPPYHAACAEPARPLQRSGRKQAARRDPQSRLGLEFVQSERAKL